MFIGLMCMGKQQKTFGSHGDSAGLNSNRFFFYSVDAGMILAQTSASLALIPVPFDKLTCLAALTSSRLIITDFICVTKQPVRDRQVQLVFKAHVIILNL